MDHLALPQNANVNEHDIVPYVCRERYDGKPFLTYPLRLSHPKPHFTFSSFQSVLSQERENGLSTSELEILFQTWLFFGLLHEVFGHHFKYEDFLDHSDIENPKVTTRHLSTLVAKLEDELKTYKIEDSISRESHIDACLNTTYTVMHVLHPQVNEIQPIHPNFRLAIKNSIVFLADRITGLRKFVRTVLHRTPDIRIRRWGVLIWDNRMENTMIKNGWCPSQIETVSGGSLNLETLWFLSRLRRPDDIGRHNDCNKIACKTFQIDPQTYRPLHRLEGCSCQEFLIDRTKLDAFVQDGSYPLLRINKKAHSQEITLDIVRGGPEMPYLAISHVWADGMGNPVSNSIPQCQLVHLLQLSTRLLVDFGYRQDGEYQKPARSASAPPNRIALAGQDDSAENSRTKPYSKTMETVPKKDLSKPFEVPQWTGELLLWIDTLCCPTEPPYLKDLALTQIRGIYSNAIDVLVLDKYLQKLCSKELPVIDLCFHISSSNWARRLWTTQEAYLSRRLWFQFADVPKLAKAISAELLCLDESISWFLLAGCMMDRMKAWPYGDQAQSGLGFVQTCESIIGRSVSVASDEPICLATLLGLDIASIIRYSTEHQSRMAKVWELGCEKHQVGQSIIFHSGERLSQLGFRWAPKSLLELKSESLELLRVQRNGTITDHGLRVKLPGFCCSRASGKLKMLRRYSRLSSFSSMPMVRTNINGAWLKLRLGPENDSINPALHEYYEDMNVEATILLRDAKLESFISENSSMFYSALLGYTSISCGKRIFHSIRPILFFVCPPELSYALSSACDVIASVSDENAVSTICKLPALQQIEDDEVFSRAMQSLKSRINDLSRSKMSENSYIQATKGKYNNLDDLIFKLLYEGYEVITEILDDEERIVD